MRATIAIIGDLMFDTSLREPRLLFDTPGVLACDRSARAMSFVYSNTRASRDWLGQRGVGLSLVATTSHITTCRPLSASGREAAMQPFAHLAPLFRRADAVLANLECPLSDRGRPTKLDCSYRASPAFAAVMAEANVKLVTCANNHIMDFGDFAFVDTLEALEAHGISVAGAGLSYDAARRPLIVRLGDARVGLCAYNMMGPDAAYASPGVGGVSPLNFLDLEEDAARLRGQVDCLVAAVHGGIENVGEPAAQARWMAHRIADLGFDLIVGWHPHVPGPIEFTDRSLILYSMGNFAFGHGHDGWGINMVVIVEFENGRVEAARVIPIDTEGDRVCAPVLAEPERAARFLDRLAAVSVNADVRIDAGPGARITRRAHG